MKTQALDKKLTPDDISITTDSGIFFYSFISCITPTGIYYNNNFMEANKDTLVKITAGKFQYEMLKLSTSQEDIQKLIDNAVDEPIQAYIDNKLSSALSDTNSKLHVVLSTLEDSSKEIHQTTARVYQVETNLSTSHDRINKAYEHLTNSVTKYDWSSLDNIRAKYNVAISEFQSITAELKKLFR